MSSRRDQKDALRAERLAKESAAKAADQRRKALSLVAALLVLAVIVIGALLLVSKAGGGDPASSADPGEFPTGSVPAQRLTDTVAAAKAASCELRDDADEGNDHTDKAVIYKANPPTSGDHYPIASDDGAYLEAPRVEHTIHSLEHGRIDAQWRPGAPDQVVGALKALYDEDPYHMLLFPNQTKADAEVVATAWTHALICPSYNERVPDAIRAFRDEYRDQGPEQVP